MATPPTPSRADKLEDVLALTIALLADERGISIEQVRERLWKAPQTLSPSSPIENTSGPKLIRLKAVKAKVGFSTAAIYKWMAAGRFPRPVKIGSSSAWRESDIDAWVDGRQR